jgi:hypothetical protein
MLTSHICGNKNQVQHLKIHVMRKKLMCGYAGLGAMIFAFTLPSTGVLSQAAPTHFESLKTMPGGDQLVSISQYNKDPESYDVNKVYVPRLNENQRKKLGKTGNGIMVFDNTKGFLFYSASTSTWESIQDRHTSPDQLVNVTVQPEAPVNVTASNTEQTPVMVQNNLIEHPMDPAPKKKQRKEVNSQVSMERSWQKFALRTKKFFRYKKCKTCPDW